MLIYFPWKLWMSPFIWGMVDWSAPRGCRVTDQNVEECWLTPEHSKTMQKLVSLHLASIMSIYQKISKFLHPYVAQYLLFQMRYGSLICSKKWLNKRPDCGGMFLRLEGMTVLEWCEDRGCFSLSDCHLAVNQNWAGFHTSFERGESGLSADIWI